jgi:beta-glucanase (GH16 family)
VQEFLGGDNARVQSNYFGKADQTDWTRMVQVPVTTPQNQWHTYGLNWTSAALTYLVDGVAVRTLKYEDAKGGTRYPQTPMRLSIGIWAGGDPTNKPGTIEWAGGLTDYSKAPYTMAIDSVTVTNYSPADKYHYKDNSGDWKSIEVIGGSAGGIVSPAQQSAQNNAVSSSTDGQSTASTKVPDIIGTATGELSTVVTTTPSFGNTTINTSTISTGTKTPTAPVSTTSSASKTSSTGAKASSAASGLGGAREIAGFSLLSVLSLILFV